MRAVLHWFRKVVTATGFCAVLCWPATSAPSFGLDARPQAAGMQPLGSRDPVRAVTTIRGPDAALVAFGAGRQPGQTDGGSESKRSGNGGMALLLAGLGVAALAAARAPRRQ